MRRRIRRRAHRAQRSNRNLDWLVGVNTLGEAVLEDGTLPTPTGWSPLFSLLDTTDVVSQDHHCTVLRVVGDFSYLSAGVRNSEGVFLGDYLPFLQAGILVQEVDNAGDVQDIDWDTSFSPDLELSWLWLKDGPAGDTMPFRSFNPGGGTVLLPGENFDRYYSFHLDLKVKRKLGERQELVFWARVLNGVGWALPSVNSQLSWAWQSTMRVLVQQSPNHPAGASP